MATIIKKKKTFNRVAYIYRDLGHYHHAVPWWYKDMVMENHPMTYILICRPQEVV